MGSSQTRDWTHVPCIGRQYQGSLRQHSLNFVGKTSTKPSLPVCTTPLVLFPASTDAFNLGGSTRGPHGGTGRYPWIAATLIRRAGIKDSECGTADRGRRIRGRRVREAKTVVSAWAVSHNHVWTLGRVSAQPGWSLQRAAAIRALLDVSNQAGGVWSPSEEKHPLPGLAAPRGGGAGFVTPLSPHRLERCPGAFVPGHCSSLWVLAPHPLSVRQHQRIPLAPSPGFGYQALIWHLFPPRVGTLSSGVGSANPFVGADGMLMGPQCL